MSAVRPSCGGCARAHLVHESRRLGREMKDIAVLQCRALPPRPNDLGPFSHYPAVRPDGYCHLYFQPGEPATEGNADA